MVESKDAETMDTEGLLYSMDQGCLTRLWFRMLVMGSTDPQLAEVPLKLSKYIFFVKNYCQGSTSLLSFSLYSLISFSPSWLLPYPWNSFSPCPYRPKSLSLTFSHYPNCPLDVFPCMNDRQLEWNVVTLASIIFLSLQDNVLPLSAPLSFPKSPPPIQWVKVRLCHCLLSEVLLTFSALKRWHGSNCT